MAHSKRRSHPRVPAGVTVTMHTADGRAATVQAMSDVSLGGVFVQMSEPLALGEEVTLAFELPARTRRLECRGIVVWSSRAPVGREAPTEVGRQGIGVRLMGIGVADMRALADYIERNLKS